MKKRVLAVAIFLTVASSSPFAFHHLKKSHHEQMQQELAKQAVAADLAILEEERQVLGDRFYYTQLRPSEQEDYLRLVHGLRQFNRHIPLKSQSSQEISRIYLAVSHDFPEFYWLAEESGTFSLADFPYPEAVQDTYHQLQEIGNQVIAQMPEGSDYEKVKYLYDYLIHQTDYNTEALTNTDLLWDNQSIRSVFLGKRSVCAGYSRAFQFLCQKAGLTCIYVAGDIVAYDLPHAWNLVKIDGQYYPVDTTWGDPVFESALGQEKRSSIDYSYLCMPQDLFEATHTAWQTFHNQDSRVLAYPDMGKAALGYYQLSGSFFEQFNHQELISYVEGKLQGGQSSVTLQFGQQAAYEQALADLGSDQPFIQAAIPQTTSYSSYRYHYNSHTHVITIELT